MTKAQKAEREQAIAQLREWIKPGDTVYTILDHVSTSGMSRAIRVVLLDCEDGKAIDRHPNWAVGKALGLRHWKRHGREQDALVVGGCGMDMGFHLVYELSHTLYGARLQPDVYLDSAMTLNTDGSGPLLTRDGAPAGQVYVGGYRCLGQGKCPSNYHVNYRRIQHCSGGQDASGDHVPCFQGDDGLYRLRTGTGEHLGVGEVCPTCKGKGEYSNPTGPQRFDLTHTDGYALRQRWL